VSAGRVRAAWKSASGQRERRRRNDAVVGDSASGSRRPKGPARSRTVSGLRDALTASGRAAPRGPRAAVVAALVGSSERAPLRQSDDAVPACHQSLSWSPSSSSSAGSRGNGSHGAGAGNGKGGRSITIPNDLPAHQPCGRVAPTVADEGLPLYNSTGRRQGGGSLLRERSPYAIPPFVKGRTDRGGCPGLRKASVAGPHLRNHASFQPPTGRAVS
jgi:hypothetical protein